MTRILLEGIKDKDELIKMLSECIQNCNTNINIDMRITADNEVLEIRESKPVIEKTKAEFAVEKLLSNIGVPVHVSGYNYLKDAIIMANESPRLMDAVTKELYPKVAEKNHTDGSRVERAIRHAVGLAWTKRRTELTSEMFRHKAELGERPSNSEFLATVLAYMRHNN